MRRISLRLVVLAFAVVSFGSFAVALAQEATPDASTTGGIAVFEAAPGITIETFIVAPSGRAPGQTVSMSRLVFQPGSEIAAHRHPGTTMIAVESGTWGWTLLEGTAHVVRGAGAGGMEVEDVTEPGTEVLLERGDAIFYEDDVVHTARGASDEPTVIFGTLILASGEPVTIFAEMDMASPEA